MALSLLGNSKVAVGLAIVTLIILLMVCMAACTPEEDEEKDEGARKARRLPGWLRPVMRPPQFKGGRPGGNKGWRSQLPPSAPSSKAIAEELHYHYSRIAGPARRSFDSSPRRPTASLSDGDLSAVDKQAVARQPVQAKEKKQT